MSNYDPTDLRGQQRAQVDEAAQKKLARDTETADVKWLMGSKRGRRIVRRWLEDVGVIFSDSETPGSSFNENPALMAYVEGRMSQARRVEYLVLMSCPEQFVLMQQEAKDDYRNAGAEQRSK